MVPGGKCAAVSTSRFCTDSASVELEAPPLRRLTHWLYINADITLALDFGGGIMGSGPAFCIDSLDSLFLT